MAWWIPLVEALTRPILTTIIGEFKSAKRRRQMRDLLRRRVILPRLRDLSNPDKRRAAAELFVLTSLNIPQEGGMSIMSMLGMFLLKAAWMPEKIKAIDMILAERWPDLEDIEIHYDEEDEHHYVTGDDKDAIKYLIKDLTRIVWGI